MFGLITIDGETFIIVKEEISKNGELPKICPFETYGFIKSNIINPNRF